MRSDTLRRLCDEVESATADLDKANGRIENVLNGLPAPVAEAPTSLPARPKRTRDHTPA